MLMCTNKCSCQLHLHELANWKSETAQLKLCLTAFGRVPGVCPGRWGGVFNSQKMKCGPDLLRTVAYSTKIICSETMQKTAKIH